jgi:hypothetical protein
VALGAITWSSIALATSPSELPEPPAAPALGAGFRYSTYGPAYDPGPEYWAGVGQAMSAKFPGSRPQAIWIVGNFAGTGTILTFPGTYSEPNINYSLEDNNEEALTLFDEVGLDVWLQVEPGSASVDSLIGVVMDRYGHHPSVIGFGIDVEWLDSDGTPEGRPVTDQEAAAWVTAVRAHDPDDRLFLKHWEREKMPGTVRDGIVFVDDSQQFGSRAQMVGEFGQWGRAFAPAPSGFQYGYPADQVWWSEFEDPAAEVGQAILDAVPTTEGLFWVDFTAVEVFPPDAPG